MINARLKEWAETAQSERPFFIHGGLASDIVRHCTPVPSDLLASIRNEPSPFAKDHSAKTDLTRKERRAQLEREILIRIARDDTLDVLPIDDEYFAKAFDILALIQANPGISQVYAEAIPYLRRLFVEREQIALARHRPNTATIDFMFVVNRLLDDL